MNNEISIEQILRWRLAQAEVAAPAPVRAARLLAMARPWWEVWPEKFRALARQLGHIHIAYDRAMATTEEVASGGPVPLLLVLGDEKSEASARILFLSVRNSTLRLRFQLAAAGAPALESFELTFVNSMSRPLFSATATPLVDGEYRLDVDLPDKLAADWKHLKVSGQMPFRLIMYSDQGSTHGLHAARGNKVA